MQRSVVAAARLVGLAWLLGLSALGGPVRAQSAPGTCQPSWLPTFGGLPGAGADTNAISLRVSAFATFDDGSGGGPALYVGGSFQSMVGVPASGIAKWNGSTWSALGSGINGSGVSVRALAVFDDGTGPALYAGGSFTMAGGVAANRIARWDGSSWSALGSGIGGGGVSSPEVAALAVFDDGSGPALYVGGDFTTAGGVPALHVAKWDGSSWSALGAGIGGSPGAQVHALTAFDDGNGTALFVGGSFATAGGAPANGIARWNGADWLSISSGGSDVIRALAVFDDGDGDGPALFSGGSFETVQDGGEMRIAKWNGASWSQVGDGIGTSGEIVDALAVFDDGSGAALYAGGRFTTAGNGAANDIAKWNGASWSPLGSGIEGDSNASVDALAGFDGGSGPVLFAAGFFTSAGGLGVDHIATWNGAHWSAIGTGLNGEVDALALFDDGSGPALYAGGEFISAGGVAAKHIARWNGTSWSPLGSGVDGPEDPAVHALTVFDDGSGPALYAGGAFTTAGGVAANNIAKWDGSEWLPLGAGLNGAPTSRVLAMAVYDPPGPVGPSLFAGGKFGVSGSVTLNNVARWDGTSWLALGAGLTGGENPRALAMAVFDDGTGHGQSLHVGGDFFVTGVGGTKGLAKWNGVQWSAVGGGMGGATWSVDALTVFDDGHGGGPALYAGGHFGTAGGLSANNIARWSGTSWSTLANGTSPVFFPVLALAAFDDGTGGGPALFAAGSFSNAGGVPANDIARWNGSTWSPLGSGMKKAVSALAVFDDGSGPALHAGGSFSLALDSHDAFLATWRGCAAAPGLWEPQGVGLAGAQGIPQLAGSGVQVGGGAVVIALDHAKASSPSALFVGLSNAPTPFKGGILLPIPVLLTISSITSAAGTISLPFNWPPGLPPAFSIYYQYAIQDAAAVQGVALSNGLHSKTP